MTRFAAPFNYELSTNNNMAGDRQEGDSDGHYRVDFDIWRKIASGHISSVSTLMTNTHADKIQNDANLDCIG